MADLEFTLEDMQGLETRICELEAELDSVTKRKDEREHAVRQHETWLREARRDRDEARAERDALREAILTTCMAYDAGASSDVDNCIEVHLKAALSTTPKTEEGGR